MCLCYLFVVLLCFGLANVNSMSLNGPALTRYDPCGLGVLHFDQIKNQRWKGIINFGLYSNLDEVETEIHFNKPVVIIREEDSNSFDARRTSWSNLVVKHVAPIPDLYEFQVGVLGNVTDIPEVSKFIFNNVTLCSSEIKASQTIESLRINNKNNAQICGRRALRNTELVSVRTEAQPGDWPWHVAMLIRGKTTPNIATYDCGGNIISRTAVLTAGHCICKGGILLETSRVLVIAGTNNYKDLYQAGRQVLDAKKLVLHPAYTYEYSTSDLGIIKVNSFAYTEFVQPICLWGPTYDKTMLFEKEATIVGFGYTEENKQSEFLRSSILKIQNDSTCIDYKPDVYKMLMDEFTFCAGYGPNASVNPRNGDSGGGLVLSTMQPDHKISWFLRGILSKCGVAAGQDTCDPTQYVIYTDVAPHYGWIIHHSGLKYKANVA